MKSGKRLGKKSYEDYEIPVIIGGGGGWRLPDFRIELPMHDPAWIEAKLAELQVICEYPECDAQAVGMHKAYKHRPFLCNRHGKMLTDSSVISTFAKKEVSQAMLDDILDSTYGNSISRVRSMIDQLMEPMPSLSSGSESLKTHDSRRPQLGQS